MIAVVHFYGFGCSMLVANMLPLAFSTCSHRMWNFQRACVRAPSFDLPCSLSCCLVCTCLLSHTYSCHSFHFEILPRPFSPTTTTPLTPHPYTHTHTHTLTPSTHPLLCRHLKWAADRTHFQTRVHVGSGATVKKTTSFLASPNIRLSVCRRVAQ